LCFAGCIKVWELRFTSPIGGFLPIFSSTRDEGKRPTVFCLVLSESKALAFGRELSERETPGVGCSLLELKTLGVGCSLLALETFCLGRGLSERETPGVGCSLLELKTLGVGCSLLALETFCLGRGLSERETPGVGRSLLALETLGVGCALLDGACLVCDGCQFSVLGERRSTWLCRGLPCRPDDLASKSAAGTAISADTINSSIIFPLPMTYLLTYLRFLRACPAVT